MPGLSWSVNPFWVRGTYPEFLKDGGRKRGGFKCGITVSRQRENTRFRGNMLGSVFSEATSNG
jgi:hypothetical protein